MKYWGERGGRGDVCSYVPATTIHHKTCSTQPLCPQATFPRRLPISPLVETPSALGLRPGKVGWAYVSSFVLSGATYSARSTGSGVWSDTMSNGNIIVNGTDCQEELWGQTKLTRGPRSLRLGFLSFSFALSLSLLCCLSSLCLDVFCCLGFKKEYCFPLFTSSCFSANERNTTATRATTIS